MSDEATPFGVAVEMQKAGASMARIEAALQAKGLDAEEIALVVGALRSRSAEAPAPKSEWVASPAAAESSGASPQAAPDAPAAESRSASPQVAPEAATATCPRCGTFISALEGELVLGTLYCRACAARPDVNYPRAYRDRYWGKRDGWAWFFGLSGIVSLAVGALALIAMPLVGLAVIISGACSVLFWSGVPIGRPALVVGTAVGAVLALAAGTPPNVMAIIFVAVALGSARNKLFYKIEVPEAALEKAWRLEHDNQAARWAVATGVMVAMAMLAWVSSRGAVWATLGLSGLPVVLGAIGLSRVDPKATPPVGRRGQAIAGIALGAAVAVASVIALALGWRGL